METRTTQGIPRSEVKNKNKGLKTLDRQGFQSFLKPCKKINIREVREKCSSEAKNPPCFLAERKRRW